MMRRQRSFNVWQGKVCPLQALARQLKRDLWTLTACQWALKSIRYLTLSSIWHNLMIQMPKWSIFRERVFCRSSCDALFHPFNFWQDKVCFRHAPGTQLKKIFEISRHASELWILIFLVLFFQSVTDREPRTGNVNARSLILPVH